MISIILDIRHRNDKGFTLVEVVVVVVILVILATIAVPVFSKYFNKSYTEKTKEEIEKILESAQIVVDNLYAEASHDDNDFCIISGTGNGGYNPFKKINDTECDLHNNSLAAEIISMAGYNIKQDDPCGVALGLGRYSTYGDPTSSKYSPKKAYHIYYIIVWPYFSGSSYILRTDTMEIKKNIFVNTKNNNTPYTNINDARSTKIILEDGEEIETQLYYIKNGKGNNTDGGTMWGNLTSRLKDKIQ